MKNAAEVFGGILFIFTTLQSKPVIADVIRDLIPFLSVPSP